MTMASLIIYWMQESVVFELKIKIDCFHYLLMSKNLLLQKGYYRTIKLYALLYSEFYRM